MSFLQGFWFCRASYGRDSSSVKKHLFMQFADDLVQSAGGLFVLSREGIHNTCFRELRYLIELAIKITLISQKYSDKQLEDQIGDYKNILNDTNVGMINSIDLRFLRDDDAMEFKQHVRRTYGELCIYVHGSAKYITRRLKDWENGRNVGYEDDKDLSEANIRIAKVYSLILVLLFHSLPNFIVGDLMVNSDGSSYEWYFSKSKHIALIDEYFDYKAERQTNLENIKKRRQEAIEF